MRYPVVRLDFSSGDYRVPDHLREDAMAQLDAIEGETGVAARYASAPLRFRHLLRELHLQAGQRVTVLVDEYDKPILDALDAPDLARDNRDFLRGLYSTIKFADCPRQVHPSDRCEQVLQGQPVLRPQQSHGHHPVAALLGPVRLYGRGPRHGVRARTPRPGPGRHPPLVQWL